MPASCTASCPASCTSSPTPPPLAPCPPFPFCSVKACLRCSILNHVNRGRVSSAPTPITAQLRRAAGDCPGATTNTFLRALLRDGEDVVKSMTAQDGWQASPVWVSVRRRPPSLPPSLPPSISPSLPSFPVTPPCPTSPAPRPLASADGDDTQHKPGVGHIRIPFGSPCFSHR